MSHIFLSACVLVGFSSLFLLTKMSFIPTHSSALLGHLVFNWFLSLHFFSLADDTYIGYL